MNWLDNLLKILSGYKELVMDSVDEIQKRVEKTTKQVIKSSALFVMLVVAFLFLLIGLANYLEAIYDWTNGVGLMVVGGVLIALVLLVKALK